MSPICPHFSAFSGRVYWVFSWYGQVQGLKCQILQNIVLERYAQELRTRTGQYYIKLKSPEKWCYLGSCVHFCIIFSSLSSYCSSGTLHPVNVLAPSDPLNSSMKAGAMAFFFNHLCIFSACLSYNMRLINLFVFVVLNLVWLQNMRSRIILMAWNNCKYFLREGLRGHLWIKWRSFSVSI